MRDDFGDRMKMHEAVYTEHRVEWPYVYARIDGRGFSKFTKRMHRPYDWQMLHAMQNVTKTLVDRTHAIVGYCQSDEISLAWERDKVMFDGKVQKIVSVLAGLASSAFTLEMLERKTPGGFNPPMERIPHFDARVMGLPDQIELANAFLWRVKDCRRNAISMVAQSKYSHKSLQGKSTREMREQLLDDGITMDMFHDGFVNGTFFKRVAVRKPILEFERLQIPEKNRPEAGTIIERTEIQPIREPMSNFAEIKKGIFGEDVPTQLAA